ncbi:MAG: hypothetical protein INR73_06950 [Williamsia sp.]|nr:hypothetical protein [Williamsia sp.]
MTKFLLSIFFLVGHFAFGQSADSINKIVFSYGKSHNSWGDPGIYGRGEVIELLKTTSGDFKISRHFTTTESAGNDGKTFSKDTTQLSTKTLKIINKGKIQSWLTQLNTNKENFTVAFIKPKLTIPTKKEILQVAKKYDKLWMLTDSDFDREDKADARKGINEMKKFVGLDSFLIFKRPTIEYDMVVIDSYNGLRVLTIQNNDTTEYRCQFFQPLGQPVICYHHKNYMKGLKVFNLEANTSTQKLLPKSSMINKVLDLNNIKEEYIKWYLDKRL